MNNPVRILLIDDHTLFRESLVRLLEAEFDFQVVGHCAAIAEALRLLRMITVDVVLLDYDLGEEFGTDLFRELHLFDKKHAGVNSDSRHPRQRHA